ncbi:MAG TPA: type II secretion system protein [Thermoanaerobaculia bacterium]|jgi:type II secretory pathway pseudopilin PulG|nr:type II secretion system protein [Thermoanaerobaculia bacterium]
MRVSGGEAGYNLVVLVIAITVMTAMLAAMLPVVSQEIRRNKEEELVFRGLQYAEAIRIFQRRYQRLPNKLSELVEVKPRCIRQLWKEPMSKDGKWGLIFQNANQQQIAIPPSVPPSQTPPPSGKLGGKPDPLKPDDGSGQQTSDGSDPSSGGLNVPKNGEVVATGPIVGVYSKSHQKTILIFNGREHYDEWRFTVDMLNGGGGFQAPGQGGGAPQLSTRWIGRPWRVGGSQGGTPIPGVQNGSVPPPSTGFSLPPAKQPGKP